MSEDNPIVLRMKTPPKAAVIGTGRCGTGYVAALLDLTTPGSIGHENWWGPDVMGEPEKIVSGLDVEVSWLALPELEKLHPGDRPPIVHVIRHPVACIKSLAEIGLFGADAEPHPYRDFIREQMQLVGRDGGEPTAIEAAAQWWLSWNTRCEIVADLTVRVEDLPRQLWNVAMRLEVSLLDKFEAEPESIPTDLNHTPRGYDPARRRVVEVSEVLEEIHRQGWGDDAPAHWGYAL